MFKKNLLRVLQAILLKLIIKFDSFSIRLLKILLRWSCDVKHLFKIILINNIISYFLFVISISFEVKTALLKPNHSFIFKTIRGKFIF